MEKQTDKQLEDEIEKLKYKFPSLPQMWRTQQAELKGRKEARQGMVKIKDVLKELREFKEIHSIGVTALIGKKEDEKLQEYTDKVIESVYDFLIKHFRKLGK